MRPRLTFANVASLLALCVALGGTAYAAVKIHGKNIRNGTIPAGKLTSGAKKSLRGNLGPTGPAGAAGRPGAAGAQGPQGLQGLQGTPGVARAYGLVNNSSGSPVMQRSGGSPTVRRPNNGVFCVKAAGVDPASSVIVASLDASGLVGANTVVGVGGGGPTISQQCNGDEFQVLVYNITDPTTGYSNVSFSFIVT